MNSFIYALLQYSFMRKIGRVSGIFGTEEYYASVKEDQSFDLLIDEEECY